MKENEQKRKETGRLYYVKNKESVLKKQAKWRDENREIFNQRSRDWRIKNLDKSAANSAERRVLQKTATPSWANKKELRLMYALASWCTKNLGEKYHVDHIIPINHPLVCGLHVPWNLRVITAKENIKKSNGFSST